MGFFSVLLIILGLALFEITTSFDNAVINAEVLHTMSKRGRRWFLFWGIIIAVFLVRGLLPLLIIWATLPELGIAGAFMATMHSDPLATQAVKNATPPLFAGGGLFLVFLFFHWLFLEPKKFGLPPERFFARQGAWFYTVASLILAIVVWGSLERSPHMAFGAVLGSTAFFLVHGFKQNAEDYESRMLKRGHFSDWAKILYLEVIDGTFSIDGVLGAFAFTLSIPLILIGNGIGALVVRSLTVRNIHSFVRYKYLKNGAMYAIFVLGIVMLLESFRIHVPNWISPIAMFAILGYFFLRSKKAINESRQARAQK